MSANLCASVLSKLFSTPTRKLSDAMLALHPNKFPPGGYQYRERPPLHKWTAKDTMTGLGATIASVQQLRLNNPNAGLDPSWEACAADVIAFNCARLGYNPEWCTGGPPSAAPAVAVTTRKRAGCSSCGGRRR